MRRLLAAAVIACFGTTGCGLLLTLAWHPTTSPARLVAFVGTMFPASAARVTVAVLDGLQGVAEQVRDTYLPEAK